MPATALNPDRAVPKKFIGAVKDEWRLYSNHASDYAIGAIIGFGASSVVYSAQYHAKEEPHPIPCALKVLDLDRVAGDLFPGRGHLHQVWWLDHLLESKIAVAIAVSSGRCASRAATMFVGVRPGWNSEIH